MASKYKIFYIKSIVQANKLVEENISVFNLDKNRFSNQIFKQSGLRL